jgi:DNA-binding XRE family transcriptional regulator
MIKIDTLLIRDQAMIALEQIQNIEDGKTYLNQLSALHRWAAAEKKDSQLQNKIAEQKLRTQRILGKLLQEGRENNELVKKGEKIKISVVPDEHNRNNDKKRLSDIGVSAKQSIAFQKIYSIPEETFEEAIAKHKQAVEEATNELTTTGFIRLADALSKVPAEKRSEKADSFDKNKLINLRMENSVSQYSLSMETGVESGTICRLESGEACYPSFDTIARIAEYFNVPMEFFKTKNLL